jgi:hypothetical protein
MEEAKESQGDVKPKNKGGRPRKSTRKPRPKRQPKENALRHAVRSRAAKKGYNTPERRRARKQLMQKVTAIRVAKRQNRTGVPDGWTIGTASMQRVYDGIKADLLIDRMIETGMIEKPTLTDYERVSVLMNGEMVDVLVPLTDEGKAHAALREAMIGAVSPLTHANNKVAYIRTVLEWSKPKPAQTSNVNLNSEDWLAEALKDNAPTNDTADTGEDSAP